MAEIPAHKTTYTQSKMKTYYQIESKDGMTIYEIKYDKASAEEALKKYMYFAEKPVIREYTNTRGGARPGAGRKASPAKKVTISFRVSIETHDKIQKLREDGVDINKHLEMMIALLASPKTHREFICGGPRSGKSFQAMIMAAMDEGPKALE